MSDLTLWHSTGTRSTGAVWLLEELGAAYDLKVISVTRGESRSAAFLQVNPSGKVPAIQHRGRTVSELAAISLYLCEAFPEAGLAPAPGDDRRGDYLMWSVFRPGVLEPAMMAKARGWDVDKHSAGWGDWQGALERVALALEGGDYLLGERFSAVDILVGGALGWVRRFGLLPEDGRFDAYLDRIQSRPAFRRVGEIDAEHDAAAKD